MPIPVLSSVRYLTEYGVLALRNGRYDQDITHTLREASADDGLLAEIAPIAGLPALNATLRALAWVS